MIQEKNNQPIDILQKCELLQCKPMLQSNELSNNPGQTQHHNQSTILTLQKHNPNISQLSLSLSHLLATSTFKFSLLMIKRLKHQLYDYFLKLIQSKSQSTDKQIDPLTILQSGIFQSYEQLLLNEIQQHINISKSMYQKDNQIIEENNQHDEQTLKKKMLNVIADEQQCSKDNQCSYQWLNNAINRLNQQIKVIKSGYQDKSDQNVLFYSSQIKQHYNRNMQQNSYEEIILNKYRCNKLLLERGQDQHKINGDNALLLKKNVADQDMSIMYSLCTDCLKISRYQNQQSQKKGIKEKCKLESNDKQVFNQQTSDSNYGLDQKVILQDKSTQTYNTLITQTPSKQSHLSALSSSHHHLQATTSTTLHAHRQLQLLIKQKQLQKRLIQSNQKIQQLKEQLQSKDMQLLNSKNQLSQIKRQLKSQIYMIEKQQQMGKTKDYRVRQMRCKVQREGMMRQFGMQRERDGFEWLIQKENISSNVVAGLIEKGLFRKKKGEKIEKERKPDSNQNLDLSLQRTINRNEKIESKQIH